MKTKLMALGLLAGGAMFAQSRFSFGVNIGSNRGYYEPAYAAERPAYSDRGCSRADGNYGSRTWFGGSDSSYSGPRNEFRSDRRDFDCRDFDRDDRRRDHDRDSRREFTGYYSGFRDR
jgi:hypothetical protein